jgi:hypothetical protein
MALALRAPAAFKSASCRFVEPDAGSHPIIQANSFDLGGFAFSRLIPGLKALPATVERLTLLVRSDIPSGTKILLSGKRLTRYFSVLFRIIKLTVIRNGWMLEG